MPDASESMSASPGDSKGVEPLSFGRPNGHSSFEAREAHLLPILRKAVEDASEAIVVTEGQLDPPGPRILWVNPAFTEVTGYELAEAVGKTPRILQGPDTEPMVIQRLRDRLAAGKRFEGETVNYRKDGTPFINHWSIAPVHDDAGGVAYWVSIQRDVTEKRRLEREVLRVQTEERRRIGRDLHDSVGSDLVSAGMLLDNILEQFVEDDVLAERLRNVRAAIEHGYGDLRELTQGLSPVDLSEGSLTIALENLAARSPGVQIEQGALDLDGLLAERDIEVLAHLYWIVKEATTNALAHAKADAIVIRAFRDDKVLVLSVEDAGVGFEPEAEGTQGWGLRTMQYRADLLGADLDVSSQPGEGTQVVCRFPL